MVMSRDEKTAEILSLIGKARDNAHDADVVAALAERVVSLTSAISGEGREELIAPLLELARISVRAQRRCLQEAATRLAQSSWGERDARVLEPLRLLAATVVELGEVGLGFQYFERILAIEDERGDDPLFTLRQLVYLSWESQRLALPYAERKLALLEQRGACDADVLGDVIDLGLSQKDAGKLREALATLRRAHGIAYARADEPSLQEARAAAVQEIADWIREIEASTPNEDER